MVNTIYPTHFYLVDKVLQLLYKHKYTSAYIYHTDFGINFTLYASESSRIVAYVFGTGTWVPNLN